MGGGQKEAFWNSLVPLVSPGLNFSQLFLDGFIQTSVKSGDVSKKEDFHPGRAVI